MVCWLSARILNILAYVENANATIIVEMKNVSDKEPDQIGATTGSSGKFAPGPDRGYDLVRTYPRPTLLIVLVRHQKYLTTLTVVVVNADS